ncbi:MAG: DUF2911 domain-containing protein [Bacteroidota bacterium]|nr:DUF2911 domain-containing protein [Bacteroidota bacterium]
MKKIISICLMMVVALQLNAQQKPTDLDKSPMDMSYWPANYPILKLNGKVKDMPVARIIYSRPQKNNRTIFNGIVKYGEMWRLGANEATEIEFFKNVKIAGKPVPKGRYTLYCIPQADKWTIVVSKDNYSWGNYSYDMKKDLLRTDIKTEVNTDSVENFTIYFEDAKTGANMVMLWDTVKAVLPISL